VRVTIVGTGNMARAVATRALAGGHAVTFVGTHIGKAEDLADEMIAEGQTGAADEVDGDLVVLAVPYTEAPHAVRQHADRLSGRVLVDVTNPVDISVLEPLDVSPFRSGAEVIADVAPDGTRLVKAFNTTFAGTLLAGAVDAARSTSSWPATTTMRSRPSRRSPATAACGRSTPAGSRGPGSSRRSATCTWPCRGRSTPASPRR